MDGVVASEVLETCHGILKEGSILVLKGTIEIDDYKSKDLGDAMYRMRVREVHSLDDELKKKVRETMINIEKSDISSLDNLSVKLGEIKDDFWEHGSCQLNIKVKTGESEAIINAGERFKFPPTLINLTYLEEIFGTNALEI